MRAVTHLESAILRLLHIIASVDPADGGPIEGIIRHDATCKAAGVSGSREIACLDPPDCAHLANIKIPVHALGRRRTVSASPWNRALTHWRYSPEFIPWLRKNIAHFDAVIVNGLWNYSSFGASRVLPGGRTPYFVFTHGMMDPWFRRTYPLKHVAKQAFWLAGEGRLISGARSTFFTCEEERLQARGQFFGYAYHETVVGYGAAAPPERENAFDLAFRAAAPALGAKSYILFLSRIHPKKGCDLLLSAFASLASHHPNVDVVIAGPDQVGWRAELEALASRLGIPDRVHWTGPLYGDAKWGAFYGADAFILPSHVENFGIAVAEALACGVPVLISDKVNIWREIEAADAGIVDADTLEGTKRLLSNWLTLSNATKQAMRLAAATIFAEAFDLRKTAPALLDTMRTLL